MEDKKINRQLRHQFSIVGWAALVYYGLMNLLVMLTMAADIAKQYLNGFVSGNLSGVPDLDALMSNIWGFALTIALGILILWAWKGTQYWKTEILHREAPMKASVFFALVILMGGAQMISGLWFAGVEAVMNLFDKSVMGIIEAVSGDSDSVGMFLYISFLAPLAEEILFRGFVLRSLRPYGKRFAIMGSALLFSFFHGNILQAPFAFVAGLILGYTAAEYSIVWAIGLHVMNNMVLADLVTRLLNLFPATVAERISAVEMLAFFIAAVALLIVKRREVRDYRQGEWMDSRCLKCFFTSAGVVILLIVTGISTLSILAQ